MRSHPGYFIFWFPAIVLCTIVTCYFVMIWVNAPEIPSHGMEALISIPYAIVSLVMLPFVLGLGMLLWKRPKRAAIALPYIAPTVFLTTIGVLAYFFAPRPSDAMQRFAMSFVDPDGNPITGLDLQITHTTPGFNLIKVKKTRRVIIVHVSGNDFTLSKTRGEETEVRIQKDGFYLTSITIPHFWPAQMADGLQRLSIRWQKDWAITRLGVDACHAAINWPLNTPQPFQVILLKNSAPAISPLPDYSESDLRALEKSNRNDVTN